jgi:hypothetical protein
MRKIIVSALAVTSVLAAVSMSNAAGLLEGPACAWLLDAFDLQLIPKPTLTLPILCPFRPGLLLHDQARAKGPQAAALYDVASSSSTTDRNTATTEGTLRQQREEALDLIDP